MTNWYTADPHFNHRSMLNICRRQFSDVDEMNETILRNYASVVQDDDDLFILGDFIFGGERVKQQAERFLERIPGRKHLVVGNHDPKWIHELSGWTSVQNYLEVWDSRILIVMSHYPMMTWYDARHGSVQIFGHVHRNWLGCHNSINVGVDVWDCMPVTRHEILERANTLPVHMHWHDVEPGAYTQRV